MLNDQDQDKDFEYHDGLGDLLKEKEPKEFSWIKTLIVFLIVLIMCVLAIKFAFQLSRASTPVKTAEIPTLEDTLNDSVALATDNAQADVVTANIVTAIPAEPVAPETVPAGKTQAAPMTLKPSAPVPVAKTVTVPTAKPAPRPQSKPRPTVSAPAMSKSIIKPVSNARLPYKVIVGSFSQMANARQYCDQLRQQAQIDCFVKTAVVQGKTIYRVQAGAFTTQAQAATWVTALKQKNIDAYSITEP